MFALALIGLIVSIASTAIGVGLNIKQSQDAEEMARAQELKQAVYQKKIRDSQKAEQARQAMENEINLKKMKAQLANPLVLDKILTDRAKSRAARLRSQSKDISVQVAERQTSMPKTYGYGVPQA